MPEPGLIIAGWSDYAVDVRDFVLGHLQRSAAASVEEDGCLAFDVSIDPNNAARIYVFEHWASQAHHATHLDAPHVETYRQSVRDRDHRPVDRALQRYEVASVAPL